MLIPYVPLQLEYPDHPAPFGQIVIGPTPHMYIANNALPGFISSLVFGVRSVRQLRSFRDAEHLRNVGDRHVERAGPR